MNKKYTTQDKIIFDISLLFLFCFFLQLLGFPNKFALLGGAFIIIYYGIKQKAIRFGLREGLLFSAMFLYSFMANRNLSDVIVMTLLPTFFMLIGKYLCVDSLYDECRDKKIFHLIIVFVLGYSLRNFFNVLIYFHTGVPHARSWGDIWGGVLLATHQNIFAVPILSLMFPAFLYFKKRPVIYGSIIFAGFFFLFHSLHSLSRIPVLIWGLLILCETVLFLLLNKENKKLMKTTAKIIGGFLLLFAIIAIVIFLNFDKIQNLRFVQNLGRDGGIIHNIRFQMQLNVLRQLFAHPFGGFHADLLGLKFCHNVWLDIANASGIIPFFILIIYTIFSLIDLKIFLFNNQIDSELKYVVSGLYFVLFIFYMVEPALMANVRFFIPWPYLNGIIHAYNLFHKNKLVQGGSH